MLIGNPDLGELLRWSVGAVVLSLVLRTWLVMGLVDPVTVAGSSMEPALTNGDRVWIDRTALLFSDPDRWDVVVFRSPHQADQLCVKRVVGLPGEMIELSGGEIFVNGRPVRSPRDLRFEVRYQDWAVFRRRNRVSPEEPVRWQLGPAEFFVLGDNAGQSQDSRSWPGGPGLNCKLLLGKALGVH